jgi:hypothetical protein
MGWDKGRYYTRSKKINGRVVREYLGAGRVAELAARMDELAREKRRLDVLELRSEKGDLDSLESELQAMELRSDLLARAALLAAGYRRHNRGEWRKRRERSND